MIISPISEDFQLIIERQMFVTFFVNNWIMLLAIFMEAGGREKATWQKIEEIREPVVSDKIDTSGVSK